MSAKAAPETLTIGGLSHASGASVRSIRHYDAHGLLVSARTANGYRTFPGAAVAQVRQIRRLLATGLSLAEIRTFPACMRIVEGAGSCPQAAAVQRRRLAFLERQIADLRRRRSRLLKMLADGVAPP